MPWFESIQVSVSALWANRLRSLLTMLGLIIGIGAVILMVAIGVGAQRYVKDQFKSLGTNVVVLGSDGEQRKGFRPLTTYDAAALETQVPSVSKIAPFIAENGRAVWKSKNASGRMYGITPALVEMLDFPVLKGRFFTEKEVQERARVVVLGQELSGELFGAEEPVGKEVLVQGQPMTVIGVTKQIAFKGYLGYVERGMMMPITVVHERYIAGNTPFGLKLGLIFMEAKPDASVEEVTFQVTNLMRQRHQIMGQDDFFVGTSQQVLDTFNSIALVLTALLGFTAAISLVVGGINIMNIMLVSVTERTREIGLRKALGATEEVILTQFIIEAVLISILGGIFGLALGLGLAQIIGAFSPLKPEVTTWSIWLAVGVSGGVGLFFGVFPARRAARLDPILALRTD
ncbi:ABC transporter permease [Candidatus Cyanaurora vandensis]|uniref:ABC transporter permease n=1 Tax=Candidatus Cyanaurora vandensis TaxID=2714958 RepID=UPI00257F5871|nr:ABC transporter permease [Candidatus Cyanaurora vandensis]